MTIKKQPIELDDDVLKDLDLSHHQVAAKPAESEPRNTSEPASCSTEISASRALSGSSTYVKRPKLKGGHDYFHEIRDPGVQRELSGAEKGIMRQLDELAGIVPEDVAPFEVAKAVDEQKSEHDIENDQTYEAVVHFGEENAALDRDAPRLEHLSVSGLPEGFSARADGIYLVVKPEKADGEYEEQFLCSPLRVINRFRQRDRLCWGRSIVVTNPEGGKTTFPVLDEDLEMQGRSFLAQLTGGGLRFGKVKRAREIVLELLKDWSPDKMMLSTNRLGWSDGACEAFVLGPDRILGDTNVVSVSSDFSSFAAGLSAKGSLNRLVGRKSLLRLAKLAEAGAVRISHDTRTVLAGKSARGAKLGATAKTLQKATAISLRNRSELAWKTVIDIAIFMTADPDRLSLSCASLVAALNAADIKTTRGNQWTKDTLYRPLRKAKQHIALQEEPDGGPAGISDVRLV